jgi:hypothetical protein
MTDEEMVEWTTFECDGRTFEYLVMHGHQKTRPAGWPAHKPSPGRSRPVVDVVVRNPSTQFSVATVYPADTIATVEHAIETARRFWDQLAENRLTR